MHRSCAVSLSRCQSISSASLTSLERVARRRGGAIECAVSISLGTAGREEDEEEEGEEFAAEESEEDEVSFSPLGCTDAERGRIRRCRVSVRGEVEDCGQLLDRHNDGVVCKVVVVVVDSSVPVLLLTRGDGKVASECFHAAVLSCDWCKGVMVEEKEGRNGDDDIDNGEGDDDGGGTFARALCRRWKNKRSQNDLFRQNTCP